MHTHKNFDTFNTNVSSDNFNLQSLSSESKFWRFSFSSLVAYVFYKKIPNVPWASQVKFTNPYKVYSKTYFVKKFWKKK